MESRAKSKVGGCQERESRIVIVKGVWDERMSDSGSNLLKFPQLFFQLFFDTLDTFYFQIRWVWRATNLTIYSTTTNTKTRL